MLGSRMLKGKNPESVAAQKPREATILCLPATSRPQRTCLQKAAREVVLHVAAAVTRPTSRRRAAAAVVAAAVVLAARRTEERREENGRRSRQGNNRDFMEPDVCVIVGPDDNHDEVVNPDDVFDSGLISTDVNRDV
ncbi:uncharacterized protein LOC125030951 [Penaeus chinensis]|uniref:uncharacterized protein LOC125030951 n=1 Tax=Penaeus chinensis TaxID=139456 RepID=UPI001FB5F5EB|nr:uncharacterized protein LOC125030951 [Penaeus chinensis]